MKEYKYKINGSIYKVSVGDIDNNVAHVQVNGTPYTVELENTTKPDTVGEAHRPAAAARTETDAKVIASAPAGARSHQDHAPLPGEIRSVPGKVSESV